LTPVSESQSAARQASQNPKTRPAAIGKRNAARRLKIEDGETAVESMYPFLRTLLLPLPGVSRVPPPLSRRIHFQGEEQMATPATAKLRQIEEQSVDAQRVEQDEIAKLAYQRWQEQGYPDGSSEADWFAAEEEYALRFR
jgi:hypothetical protein